MQQESRDCICPPEAMKCTCGHKASLRIITRKIVTPSLTEMELNPRSRSAKLRAAERIIAPNDQRWEKPALDKSAGLPFLADKLGQSSAEPEGKY